MIYLRRFLAFWRSTTGVSLLLLGQLAGSALGATGGEVVVRGPLAVVPVPLNDSSGDGRMDLDNCRVHLTKIPTQGPPPPASDLLFPCNEWHPPPDHRLFSIWLEAERQISPLSRWISHPGEPATAEGTRIPLPVTEAGRVTPSASVADDPDVFLRLFQAEIPPEQSPPVDAWSRTDPVRDARQGVLAPTGRIVAGLWNRESGRYLSLSRPFEVARGQAVTAPLPSTEKTSTVLVRLRRADGMPDTDLRDVDLSLIGEQAAIPPDLIVPTLHTLLAVWYQLEPGEMELRAESARQGLAPARLDLSAGKVTHLDAQLRPRPSLDVELSVPAVLDDEDGEALGLAILRLPDREIVARQELGPGSRRHRFTRMPLSRILVILETPVGSFEMLADLTSGEDGFVFFEPPIVALSGVVFLGDEGHPASLDFHDLEQSTHSVETDTEGRYEVIIPMPVRSAEIELTDRDGPSWIEFFSRPITETRELDFHLDDVEFQVRVGDALTGEPIPGATVVFRNLFVGRDEGDQTTAQLGTTDEEGLVLLPPLREGILEVQAEADGYYPMDQPSKATISDSSSDQTIEMTLQPIMEALPLQVFLPSGIPAAGAHVLLVDSLATGRILFQETTDAEGKVSLPSTTPGVALVRHPDAAFLIREWAQEPDDDDVRWSLPTASDRPFRTKIFDDDDEPSYSNSQIVLWVQGQRLSGNVLGWLIAGRPVADHEGGWVAVNLPPGEVGILAWSMRLHEEARRGGLDTFAISVPYPWPDVVRVEVLD